jgi:bifunctional DNA-binding transcriptional regulator/antitoxin component of YhaV-PrlF toxin-antitoxin module
MSGKLLMARHAYVSKVGSKWETVLPRELRKRYRLKKGQNLIYLDMGTHWRVIPVPKDPLQSLKGSLSKGPKDLSEARKAITALAEKLALEHLESK